MQNPISDLRCASRAAIDYMEQLKLTNETTSAEVKRLRKVIVSAPHNRWCPWPKSGTRERCICWKSKALEKTGEGE